MYEPQSLAAIYDDLGCSQHQQQGVAWYECNPQGRRRVVLLHGVTGGNRDMLPLARCYVAAGYGVVMVGLPGHDGTQLPELASFTDLADWLRHALGVIGQPVDAIISNSYASAIVYQAMRQGYIPADTPVVLACPTPQPSSMANLLQAVSSHAPERVVWTAYNSTPVRSARTSILLQTKNKTARAWLHESEKHKAAYTTLRATNLLTSLLYNDNPYHHPLPPASQAATTVIMGTKDSVVTADSRTHMQRLMPHAQFIDAHGAGHILHFEALESYPMV